MYRSICGEYLGVCCCLYSGTLALSRKEVRSRHIVTEGECIYTRMYMYRHKYVKQLPKVEIFVFVMSFWHIAYNIEINSQLEIVILKHPLWFLTDCKFTDHTFVMSTYNQIISHPLRYSALVWEHMIITNSCFFLHFELVGIGTKNIKHKTFRVHS